MTTITRRNPFPPIVEPGLPAFMRSFMNDPLFSPTMPQIGTWLPAVEVSETNDAMILTAELPGLEEKNLKINIENNVLSISGEKEQETTDGPPAKAFYMTERYYGAFQRSFTLPRTVDVEHVKAVFDKGVLTITLAKLPQSKGRKIEITK